MENYPLRRTFYAKRVNRHLETTLTPSQLRGANVSKAKIECTLIDADDYLAFDSKYTFTVRILNQADDNGIVPMYKDSIVIPERNGEANAYVECDGKYWYLMKVPISEMDNLRQLVAERLGVLWNPDSVDLDWIEEAECLDYEEFRNGIETTD